MAKHKDDHDFWSPSIISFIIKIWVEETLEETGETIWRGHITHIPSRQRSYVKSLDDILDFVGLFLMDLGIDLGTRWQICQWLKRHRSDGKTSRTSAADDSNRDAPHHGKGNQ